MVRGFNDVSAELSQWFDSVLGLTERSLFGIAPEGPHRDAVVLDTMIRNARIVFGAELDADGRLYSPLCFFLASACRHLRTTLGPGHWRAALENVSRLRKQWSATGPEYAALGLDLDTPAARFKTELDEAVRQAGLIDGAGFLSKEDRRIAIGLAINWGMRLLLAYAADSSCAADSSARRDLAWLAERVRSALAKQT